MSIDPLTVGCPTCDAGLGMACINMASGLRKISPHTTRKRLANPKPVKSLFDAYVDAVGGRDRVIEARATPNIWVLTWAANAYDQYGDYFVAAWVNKPCGDQIRAALVDYDWWPNGLDMTETIAHILAGGGRRGYEDDWYTLIEHTPKV